MTEQGTISRRGFFKVAGAASAALLTGATEPAQAHENLVKEQKPVALVVFSATWCPPCQILKPEVKKLGEQNPDIKIYNFDVDKVKAGEYQNPESLQAAMKQYAKTYPAMVLIGEKSKVVSVHLGTATAEEIKTWMDYHRAADPAPSDPDSVKRSFDDKSRPQIISFYQPGSLREARLKILTEALPAATQNKFNFIAVNINDMQNYKGHPIERFFLNAGAEADKKLISGDGLSILSDVRSTESLQKWLSGLKTAPPAPQPPSQ